MAAPTAYGSSWAKGQIGAIAAAYATAMATLDPSHLCDLCCSCQILNPLSEARDRTHILHRDNVRSLIAAPQWELCSLLFLGNRSKEKTLYNYKLQNMNLAYFCSHWPVTMQ